MAGVVESAPPGAGQFATHYLRVERTGAVIASLRDTRALLPQLLPAKVVLHATQTGRRDVNGLPLLDVDGVLPEHWAQPVGWKFFVKGPGAYSGFGRDSQRKDFAGVPFGELRAYENDSGLEGAAALTAAPPGDPPPLRVRNVQLTRTGFAIHWDAVSGIRYQLLSSTAPEGPYRLVNEIIPLADGDQSLEVTLTGARGFFRIVVSEP